MRNSSPGPRWRPLSAKKDHRGSENSPRGPGLRGAQSHLLLEHWGSRLSTQAPSPGSLRAEGGKPLCCVPCPGPSFVSSKAKERRGRCSCSPSPHSALTVLPAWDGAGRCFPRPFPRGCQPWASSCSPSKCSLAAPAAFTTSSCQTAACRAVSSPEPHRPPGSAQGLWCQTRVQTEIPQGQEEWAVAAPPCPGPFPCPIAAEGRLGEVRAPLSTQECALGEC